MSYSWVWPTLTISSLNLFTVAASTRGRGSLVLYNGNCFMNLPFFRGWIIDDGILTLSHNRTLYACALCSGMLSYFGLQNHYYVMGIRSCELSEPHCIIIGITVSDCFLTMKPTRVATAVHSRKSLPTRAISDTAWSLIVSACHDLEGGHVLFKQQLCGLLC